MELKTASRESSYQELRRSVAAVLGDESDPMVWMTTIACLIREQFGFLWVGFYLAEGGGLKVGPYQGSLGCLRIPFGRGVCGTSAMQRRTVLVPDVHQFSGHIACDSRSNSEIVVPVFDAADRLRAVLDIDSENLNDFSDVDRVQLEAIVGMMRSLRWPQAL